MGHLTTEVRERPGFIKIVTAILDAGYVCHLFPASVGATKPLTPPNAG